MHHIIDALLHRHLGLQKNVFSAHGRKFYFVGCSSQSSVPSFRPSTASRNTPGLYVSRTTMWILLSMHRLNAVESMICKRFASASEKASWSKRRASGYLFGSRS